MTIDNFNTVKCIFLLIDTLILQNARHVNGKLVESNK